MVDKSTPNIEVDSFLKYARKYVDTGNKRLVVNGINSPKEVSLMSIFLGVVKAFLNKSNLYFIIDISNFEKFKEKLEYVLAVLNLKSIGNSITVFICAKSDTDKCYSAKYDIKVIVDTDFYRNYGAMRFKSLANHFCNYMIDKGSVIVFGCYMVDDMTNIDSFAVDLRDYVFSSCHLISDCHLILDVVYNSYEVTSPVLVKCWQEDSINVVNWYSDESLYFSGLAEDDNIVRMYALGNALSFELLSKSYADSIFPMFSSSSSVSCGKEDIEAESCSTSLDSINNCIVSMLGTMSRQQKILQELSEEVCNIKNKPTNGVSYLSIVNKIIQYGLNGDTDKVRSYATLLLGNLCKSNKCSEHQIRMLRNTLDGVQGNRVGLSDIDRDIH